MCPVSRRGIWADVGRGRGSGCQLCPSLPHPGRQSGLPSFSRRLRRSAVHLSARLLGQLHPQPGAQNTQVGSLLGIRCGLHSWSRWLLLPLWYKNNGFVCLFAGRWWKARRVWAEPFRRSVHWSNVLLCSAKCVNKPTWHHLLIYLLYFTVKTSSVYSTMMHNLYRSPNDGCCTFNFYNSSNQPNRHNIPTSKTIIQNSQSINSYHTGYNFVSWLYLLEVDGRMSWGQ